MPLEYTFAAFGIAAAVILIGGAMILRYHRDRHHFALMQTALDKGITTFPGMPPAWLISLRVGVLSLVLGIGLIGSGIALYTLADHIEPAPMAPNRPNGPPLPPGYQQQRDEFTPNNPPQATPTFAPQHPIPRTQFIAYSLLASPAPSAGPPAGPPARGPGRGQGAGQQNNPGQQGPGPQNYQGPGPQNYQGPGQPNFQGPNPQNRPNPPQGPGGGGGGQGPAMERWHRIQTQRTFGLVTLCAGSILVLLGIVRIAFARIERRYATESSHTP